MKMRLTRLTMSKSETLDSALQPRNQKRSRGSNTQLMSPESSAGRGRKWGTKGSVSTSAQGKRGASGKVTKEAWDGGRESGGRVRKVAGSLLR